MTSSDSFSWERGPMHLVSVPKLTSGASGSNPNTTAAAELATIHNIFIRALNSIYIQAPSIPLSESSHFTTYSLSIYRCLIAYDAPSSPTFFTALARLTNETQLTSEHAVFDAPLRAWGTWLESCAARKNNFSGVICRDFMHDFMPALQRHLAGIPARLAARTSVLGNVGVMLKAHLDKVFGDMSRTEELPGMLCNHDGAMGEFSGGLEGWKGWMMRNVWAKKYEEVWKFGTAGWDGRKREVMFADREQGL